MLIRSKSAAVAWFPEAEPVSEVDLRNVAFGPRINGGARISTMLSSAGSCTPRCGTRWSELRSPRSRCQAVSNKWHRAVPWVEPDVILMDEPCSSLDPIATSRHRRSYGCTEARLHDRHRHAQHAASPRVSDMTALMTAEVDDAGHRIGRLVEFDATDKIFTILRSTHQGIHHRPVRVGPGVQSRDRAVRRSCTRRVDCCGVGGERKYSAPGVRSARSVRTSTMTRIALRTRKL